MGNAQEGPTHSHPAQQLPFCLKASPPHTSGTSLLPTSEPAVSAPSPTHFPGATSSQVFPTVRRPPWPSSTGWISHTGNNLC